MTVTVVSHMTLDGVVQAPARADEDARDGFARQLAERYFTISAWTEHDVGGHFPGVAEPRLLARTLRDVLRPRRRSR